MNVQNYAAFPTKKQVRICLRFPNLLYNSPTWAKSNFHEMLGPAPSGSNTTYWDVHAFWSPGHNATDYKRLYSSSPAEIYKVTKYQSAYEPYVIFKKDGPPWCDERFVGYGGNKLVRNVPCRPVKTSEDKYNRKLYADFKEETCLL